jgi:hypothetical protein
MVNAAGRIGTIQKICKALVEIGRRNERGEEEEKQEITSEDRDRMHLVGRREVGEGVDGDVGENNPSTYPDVCQVREAGLCMRLLLSMDCKRSQTEPNHDDNLV